jgi:predicted kinase/predicted phosphodiesterase
LIVLSGIPASGKSTFITKNNLEGYVISSDSIRLELSNPVLTIDGTFQINQQVSTKAWKLVNQRIEEKLKKGDLCVVDATHTKSSYFSRYLSLCNKYGYELAVVQFDIDIDEAVKRDSMRPEYKQVGEEVITRLFDSYTTLIHKEGYIVIKSEDFKLPTLSDVKVNLEKFEKIVHIGDIQGMGNLFQNYLLQNPINPNYLYVFCGDLVDRGDSNDLAVITFFELLKNENVVYLEGNHDTFLRNWAYGIENEHAEFINVTQKQLENNPLIEKRALKSGFDKLRTYLFYQYNDKEVFVCHGGIPKLPHDISLVNSNNFIKGTGAYAQSQISDERFCELNAENQFLIHGHRNQDFVPTKNTSRTFNLEGKVEFPQKNGQLRIVELTKLGFEVVHFPELKY